jgi:hypothetical protein
MPEDNAPQSDRALQVLNWVVAAEGGDAEARRMLAIYRQDTPGNEQLVAEVVEQFRREGRMP